MNELLYKNISDSAGDYHNRGFNCAESIFLAFRGVAAPDLSEDMVRIATPFGGGIGRSGCVCGALSGAVIILGAARGRTTPETPRKESYELSNEFHNRFKSEFGATCCRVLVKDKFGSKEQGERCYQIITGSAELLMKFLVEKGIA
jgi:C_GCAxxG_C_C family probable redox protein